MRSSRPKDSPSRGSPRSRPALQNPRPAAFPPHSGHPSGRGAECRDDHLAMLADGRPSKHPALKAEVLAGVKQAPAWDETRNCGEINRELLLRPEAEVVLGRAVRRCRPTAGFVRCLQPEAADPNRRTYRRASPRETKSGAPMVVANLVPTHDRGRGPPGGPVGLAAAIAQEQSRLSSHRRDRYWCEAAISAW